MNHKLERPLIMPPSPVFIPHDLIVEVFSFLPVKSVIRFTCMSRKFDSLVSDPTFVNLHLHRYSRNQDASLIYPSQSDNATFTVFRLSENRPPRLTLPNHPYYHHKYKHCLYIVGSCNGLLCLGHHVFGGSKAETWIRFWNPATRILSGKLPASGDGGLYNLTFGYDSSTDTYMLVHFIPDRTEVKVLKLGDNVWKNIQNSPIWHPFPLHFVNLSGSVIWLAIRNYPSSRPYNCKNITIQQFWVISLDLGAETHTRLSLPQGFIEVPFVLPYLSVLKDSLCFSHDFRKTHFIIWKMKEFGVEESWTQLFKIRYHDLQIYDNFCNWQIRLLPLCLSEKRNTLLMTNPNTKILYNWRYNKAESTNILWPFGSPYYNESLVSYR
ncbi:F-box protein CPR1-like [Vicia villosa]|uniref:F-box protein CPR1-like n=1 Tax=Vicia villosa TaxID=3911 RepID=UPI00273CA2A1|nr:F-box protein CPR1-like [Vicia villosa]